jgi:hypothetical protein
MNGRVTHSTCFAWYKDGVLHRDGDLPAIIFDNGQMEWYNNGRPHRDGDKPAVMDTKGNMSWVVHGRIHRAYDAGVSAKDQPAVILEDGSRRWYCNDVLHRDTVDINGEPLPAVITPTCSKWMRNGRFENPGYDWIAKLPNGSKGYYNEQESKILFEDGSEHILNEELFTIEIVPCPE